MSIRKAKTWMVREDDANDTGIIGALHAIEAYGVAMIKGIGHFLAVQIPEWLNVSVEWLRKLGRIAARIGARFLRVAVVLTAWLVIVFGPLALFTDFVTAAWAGVALLGSWWGLRRFHRKRVDDKATPAASRLKFSAA